MAGDPHQEMAGGSFLRVKLSSNDLIFPNDSLVNKDSTGRSQKTRDGKYYICSKISMATKAPWWWLFIFFPVQPETCVNDPIYIFFLRIFFQTREVVRKPSILSMKKILKHSGDHLQLHQPWLLLS